MIGMVIGLLITLIISVLVVYTIVGGIDLTTADNNIKENVYGWSETNWDAGGTNSSRHNWNESSIATNATDNILDQAATFFQIAPIIAIVVVAVVILGYVGKIGGT